MFTWLLQIPGVGAFLRWLFPSDPNDTDGRGPFG